MKVLQTEQRYQIQVTVTNTGDREGKEAVLFFVKALESNIHRPFRELKGFEKITLKPGESKVVIFETNERTFAVWNDGWRVYKGMYMFEVGNCSEIVSVSGESWKEAQMDTPVLWYHSLQGEPDREVWKKTLPTAEQTVEEAEEIYTVNSTIAEVKDDVLLLKIIYYFFEKKQAETFGRESVEYLAAMSSANECPLRAVQNFIGMKNHFAQAMADLGNKHFRRGIIHLLK